MTIERLRSVHQARPFRPFTLHTADGKKIRIPHPEVLALSPSGRTVVICLSEDNLDIIDVLMIVRIEVSNGVARRRSRR
jgi:hypothetical protein